MIETVQERQRGAYNFESYYDNLCALQDTCPIPAVKGHLHEGIFDINGDRIRQQDWNPIFNSIKINKSLKFISIRSYFQLNLENGMPEKKAKILRSRIPVIRTKEMTATLCKVLRDCLATTENLECLELQGIHLRESDITLIGQGLMKNSTLKHLSLESCRIGDSGLIVLCSAMKMAGNISTLNLTACSVSPIGLRGLGDLIKFQAMSRHNEAWKESLRYRWANFDTMCGIRRMTLNRNLGIGDEGSLILAESLKDDLWVKAIDLQECSLTSNAVRCFLKVLKYNSTLVVLDLRRNPMIDRDLLKSVTEQVLVNGDGKETEYKWLRVKDLMRSADENYDRHPRSYYNGPTKPLNFVSRPVFKPAGRLRSKSAGSVDRRSNEIYHEENHNKASMDNSRTSSARNLNNSSSKGQPWRTAARAIRYKGYPPDHVPGKNNIEEHFEESDEINQIETFHKKSERVPQKTQIEQRSLSKNRQNSITTDDDQTSSVVSPLINGAEQYPPMPKSIKDLKTEIFHLREQLDKYQKYKSDIELKLDEICTENRRLRNTIKIISRTNAVIAERTEKSSILQNEAILETIENSFKQFNAFLDMLRESGLGKIVTAAGMDQFSTTQEILQNIGQHPRFPKPKHLGTADLNMKNDLKDKIISNSKSVGKDPKKIATIDENAKNDGHLVQSSKSNSEEIQHSLHNSLSREPYIQSHEQEDFDGKNSDRDEILESVGWKNNSNKFDQNSNNFLIQQSTDASKNYFNELDKNNVDEINDPVEKPFSSVKPNNEFSNDEQLDNEYFENFPSSTSSIATYSKRTRATNEAMPNYAVEDSTIVTESIENGMDNELNINNPFTNQLSLDTVHDISFDNSNLDMY